MKTALARDLEQASRGAYQAAHAEMLRLARADFPTFVTYVMRDERTNAPIEMQPFQIEWWRLCETFDRLLILAFMESGKSFCVAVAYTLWELGRDPSLQFAIVSKTTRQAKRIMGLLSRYLTRSAELLEVFPWLRPDRTMPWNSEQFSVVRPGVSKDPSVQVVSMGRTVQGARLDRVVLDDVLDRENTRTPNRREDAWDWYQKSIPGRLTERAHVRAIGNAFHKQDLYHRMARNEQWRAYRFPLVRPNGQSAWPKRWPLSRCDARRRELGDVNFKIQMQCEPVDIETIGMLFRRSEVHFVDGLPVGLGPFCRRWDLACSEPSETYPDPDWSIGTKMARTSDKKYLIAHVERVRTRDPLAQVRRTAEQDGRGVAVGIPQDPGQAGLDQVRSYTTALAGWQVWSERETGDKVTRALSWSTQWQAGNVILLRAAWNEPFLAIMEAFPTPGIHDDDVDSSGGAFRHITQSPIPYAGNTGAGFHLRR